DAAGANSEGMPIILFGRTLVTGVVGRSRLDVVVVRVGSTRCKPAGEFTLQRLTLSERFIMALWTKPPMPLVGDTGRVGDVRPGETEAELFADAGSPLS